MVVSSTNDDPDLSFTTQSIDLPLSNNNEVPIERDPSARGSRRVPCSGFGASFLRLQLCPTILSQKGRPRWSRGRRGSGGYDDASRAG